MFDEIDTRTQFHQRKTFMHVDPEFSKKDSQVSTVILHFWVPQSVKVVRRILMKLTPGKFS